MAASSKQPNEDFATALAFYQARQPRYTGEALARRRDDWEQAVGISKLDGLPAPDDTIAELWITGRVTDREHLALVKLAAQERSFLEDGCTDGTTPRLN
jgi:hypothetical protein